MKKMFTRLYHIFSIKFKTDDRCDGGDSITFYMLQKLIFKLCNYHFGIFKFIVYIDLAININLRGIKIWKELKLRVFEHYCR